MQNSECGVLNAECGMQNAECLGAQQFDVTSIVNQGVERPDIPHSAFCILHSEFRIPNSALKKRQPEFGMALFVGTRTHQFKSGKDSL